MSLESLVCFNGKISMQHHSSCGSFNAAEAILLGFQHYLVMLGTTVIIPTALVPQMGGGNVRLNYPFMRDP